MLVRHAMPVVDPATPVETWALSDEGRRAAARLGRLLPTGALVVASDEPKAFDTAVALGLAAPLADARLREVARDEPFGGSFRERRRAFVEGALHDGWEPHAAVVARVDACVRERLRDAGDARRPLVVVGHGMSLVVWLTEALELPDPGALWEDLRFPDALRVDLEAGTVEPVRRPPAGVGS